MGRAVSGIVNYHGKVLLGKKRSDSPKFLAGKWHIPGETVEGEESDEAALMRGMKEEVGLEIKVRRYICSSISPSGSKNVNWYECFSSSDKINPSSDLEDAKWVLKKEIFNYLDYDVINLWPEKILGYFSN